MSDDGEHYLKRELYELVQSDATVFEFLERGSLDGIWYWDLDAPEHEWLSPRFKAFFGYAEHEMEHSPEWWQAHIHPDDLTVALENYERHRADPNHPYDQLVRYRHRDGSTVWVRCRGLIIRDADGQPRRMLGAHTDLTALKRNEEELRRLYEETPALLHSIGRDGRIEYVSQLWLSHFGYDRDEVIGHRSTEFLDEESLERSQRVLERFFQTGECTDVPYRWRHKRGEYRDVRLSATAERDASGTIVRSLAILQDVTELLRTQALAAEERRRLEASLSTLDQFAYVASHDLRTPLRGVRHVVNFLREDSSPGTLEEIGPRLAQLEERVARMDQMLDALLRFARAGQLEPTPELTDVGALIAGVGETIRSGSRPEQTELELEISPSSDAPVATFPTVLEHVLFNLIQNAVTHHDRKPARVQVARRVEGEHLVVTVTDDGPGIPEREHARVFEMFRSAHKGRASTGMGLALVRRMLVQVGGTVELESPVIDERGCRFVCRIPAETPSASRTQEREA